jgi:hypothetical protein
MGIDSLKNRYLDMILLKWFQKESYTNLIYLIYEYGHDVLRAKGINSTTSPQMLFKTVDDFEERFIELASFTKERHWKLMREADENLKVYELEYEVQFYAFKEIRKNLYKVIDRWKVEEFELKKKLKKDGLAGLAEDGQNVHTQAVNNQTNDGLSVIRQISVPRGQKTLDEITNTWISHLPNTVKDIASVYEDMRRWGNVETVIRNKDWEYRKILRGVWAKIKEYDGEMFTELLKRLWEECFESVGMCAQGHLSRLANVLVGFDETIGPVISKREEFQNQIAEISKRDDSIDVKRKEVLLLMDTIDMPQDEREPWLDSL